MSGEAVVWLNFRFEMRSLGRAEYVFRLQRDFYLLGRYLFVVVVIID